MGDFNEVTSPVERLNRDHLSSSMMHFNNFINSAELIDLPLQGRKFTWRNSFSASRIDRGMVNVFTNSVWPFMSLTALSKNLSDHNPILFLVEAQVDWGPKPFRSLDYWWEKDSFASFLNQS